MILPTMTPEEKVRQASRLELDIRFAAHSWVEHNQRMLKMRKTFPYTHVIKRDFKDMGTWNILLSFKEKPNFRKGVLFASNAYQKFYVTKGAKAENIGAGVYFIGGAQTHDGVPGSGTTFYEFTPHFFNRYRQRFLAVNDLDGMSFNDLFMHVYHDINIGISPDPSIVESEDFGEQFRKAINVPRVAGYDNLVLFIRHGLCLGFTTHRSDYLCYLTFVGRDDFFRWQSDMHKFSTKLLDLYDKLAEYDPYCMVDRKRFRQAEIQRQLTSKVAMI